MTSKPSDQTSDARTPSGGATASTLGQQLRRAREGRGITLREISDHTRISMRHLEAIESDEYKHLPGGIFNRSFIRAFARAVNFNEGEALDLYSRTAREHGDATDEPPTSPQRSRVYMDGDTARSPLITWLLSLVILGALVLVVFAGLQWYRRTKDGPQNSAQANAAQGPAQASNNQAQQNASQQIAASQVPASGLQVQVKARGEDVWLDARVDDQKQPDTTLKADQTKEFKAQNSLSLRFSKDKVNALEVSINGQAAQIPPPGAKNKGIEWVITRDNYKQFLP